MNHNWKKLTPFKLQLCHINLLADGCPASATLVREHLDDLKTFATNLLTSVDELTVAEMQDSEYLYGRLMVHLENGAMQVPFEDHEQAQGISELARLIALDWQRNTR